MIRQIKTRIESILQSNDFRNEFKLLETVSFKILINPLFSLLHSCNLLTRWRAISILSYLISSMADDNIESARGVMRRLMWNLNSESGNMGWGSAEVMGAAASKNRKLFNEYSNLIISYINPKGNFLEHHMLQRGSIWAVGKLAFSRPEKIKKEAKLIIPFLLSPDSETRGIAAWASGPIKNDALKKKLELLKDDSKEINMYINNELKKVIIKTLVNRSLIM